MITKLDNANRNIAIGIHDIFQCSYKIEAQLIGVTDFPPLSRHVENIVNSTTLFYGYSVDDCLAAVIEINFEDKRLEIDSLTVSPAYFRQGIADKLIRYVLEAFEFVEARVETAVVNKPAIRLYEKHGFIAYKQWTPSHGIKKIALEIVSST